MDNMAGRLAEWIRFHTTHVEWVGCSLHDMIQPSFYLSGWSVAGLLHRISGEPRAD